MRWLQEQEKEKQGSKGERRGKGKKEGRGRLADCSSTRWPAQLAPSRLALALAKHLANIYDARNWRAINNDSGQGEGRGYSGPQWVSMCVRHVYMFSLSIFFACWCQVCTLAPRDHESPSQILWLRAKWARQGINIDKYRCIYIVRICILYLSLYIKYLSVCLSHSTSDLHYAMPKAPTGSAKNNKKRSCKISARK